MGKSIRFLACVYVVLVLLKVLVAWLVPSPTIFGDEYEYAKLAQGFFTSGSLTVHGVPATRFPPLYPIVLSLAYLFGSMQTAYLVMKVLNAVVSSLILVPAFLLLRMVVKERMALFGSVLIGFAPLSFSAAPYLMSENLFHPLFLTAVYALYRLVHDARKSFVVFAAVATVLTILTRTIGVIILILAGVLLVHAFVTRSFPRAWRLFFMIGVSVLLIAPWFVHDFSARKSVTDLVRATATASSGVAHPVMTFFIWMFIHLAYLLLATAPLLVFTLPVLPRLWLQEKQRMLLVIAIVLTLALVVLLSRNALNMGVKEITLIPEFSGRIVGRYIDVVLPVLLITGLVALLYQPRRRAIVVAGIASLAVLLLGSLLLYYPLVPYNNLSLTLVGLMKTGVNYFVTGAFALAAIATLSYGIVLALLVLAVLKCMVVSARRMITARQVLLLVLVVFVLTDIANSVLTVYNARQWNEDEQLRLSRAIATEHGPFGRLVIDERECTVNTLRNNPESLCTVSKGITLLGFWITNDVRVTTIDHAVPGDVLVTRHALALPLWKESPHGIKVYDVSGQKP